MLGRKGKGGGGRGRQGERGSGRGRKGRRERGRFFILVPMPTIVPLSPFTEED